MMIYKESLRSRKRSIILFRSEKLSRWVRDWIKRNRLVMNVLLSILHLVRYLMMSHLCAIMSWNVARKLGERSSHV
jgi:hypothetical protein